MKSKVKQTSDLAVMEAKYFSYLVDVNAGDCCCVSVGADVGEQIRDTQQ